jgi:hypothetical protein
MKEVAAVDNGLSNTPLGATSPGADIARTLVGIHGTVRAARAVLASPDFEIAIPECVRLLRQVEEMLDTAVVDLADDGRIWRTLRALRDELGGYLLATETLRDVGVKPDAVMALLHRSVAIADATL